jgi:hypothetical protein
MGRDDIVAAQLRIADERVVLPLAALPWVWVQRSQGPGALHPRFGPDIQRFVRAPSAR